VLVKKSDKLFFAAFSVLVKKSDKLFFAAFSPSTDNLSS